VRYPDFYILACWHWVNWCGNGIDIDLTDVLNYNIVIDAKIAKYGTSERELAYNQHEYLAELGMPERHVIIYDRCYVKRCA
jgi:hypothetical protein